MGVGGLIQKSVGQTGVSSNYNKMLQAIQPSDFGEGSGDRRPWSETTKTETL